VQADLTHAAGTLIACLNTIEYEIDDAFIGCAIVVRNKVILEQVFDGLGSISVDIDPGTVPEPGDFALQVNAGDESPQLFLQFVVVEVGRSAAIAFVNGNAMVSCVVQGFAQVFQRGYNRDLPKGVQPGSPAR
jgi:hypothetical protein